MNLLNPHIETARRRKVAHLLRIVDQVISLMPRGTTDAEAAERFRRFRREDRARCALLAGVLMPSDETWRDFCAAVASRKVVAAFETGAAS
jgi:hypothetical protein